MMCVRLSRLVSALALAFAAPNLIAAEPAALDAVVVTAPAMAEPLKVVTDPKAPRQPIPAHDGADFLKSIPGFSVIRKGGTDGDPVFRGMSGSRLGILLDGQEVYGGCGGRMDPPTAYVYPESYDRVTVLKGPQSVRYSPGKSAGVVLFERDIRRFVEPGLEADASLTVGSYGRNDQVVDVRGGNADFNAQASATRSEMRDYRDGDGDEVHSAYERWSTHAALGWTPDENTRIELAAGRSDGEAAYADRSMDGTRFARENASLKFERSKLTPLVEKVSAQVFYSYIDHVMDNYSLRTKAAGMFMVSNPDRITSGARADLTLTPSERLTLTMGVDTRDDVHRARSASAASEAAVESLYRARTRTEDVRFDQWGVFADGSYLLDGQRRLVGGLRVDEHRAKDSRALVGGAPNPERGETANETLTSGFVRYEADFSNVAGTWYAGLGHAARFPDYWELMRTNAATGESFRTLSPEKTTQLDLGALWSAGAVSGSVSVFYGKVQDLVLLRWVPTVNVRNIDATIFGFEADAAWRFSRTWSATAALAWVRGENDSDDTALAQQPPLEARLGLAYDDKVYSAGAMLRLVADQNRYDFGSGGIVANSYDLGSTPGFAVFSINGGWRISKAVVLTAGIDNVFDRKYAEHLSKGGGAIDGYDTPTGERIYEPGRNVWLKAQIALN